MQVTRNITKSRAVFTNLEENTEYVFHVKAYTARGSGPYSEKITIKTDKEIGRAPMSVKAIATSESSVEVSYKCVKFNLEIYSQFYNISMQIQTY